MHRLLLLILALASLLVAAAAGVALGTLPFLDWQRQHREATATLPLLTPQRRGWLQIPIGDLVFRARVAGPADGTGVILLHGFPETAAMWEPLVEALGAAGYRAIAFDQRGYSPGARPEELQAYDPSRIAEDVFDVAAAAGFDRFHLVGHDWGCVIGWKIVLERPERIRSWSALSIPLPGSLDRGGELPAYVRFFQMPWLPEAFFGFGGRAMLHRRVLPEEMSDEQRNDYEAVFSEPGALRAGFNWYRAMGRAFQTSLPSDRSVTTPTLFLWGSSDFFVTPDVLDAMAGHMKGPYEARGFPASHWLIEERPDDVIPAVVDFVEGIDAATDGDEAAEPAALEEDTASDSDGA
jgi:pimeloyl-ACP methyl ester carboxylesterase